MDVNMHEKKRQTVRVAAIVPALNEEETIGNVVETLSKSPLLDEIIVVSDGSTDQTVEVARRAGATRVIDHDEPHGKGNAMHFGTTYTHAPCVAFFDADLRGLTIEHVEQIVLPVLYESRDMNIGLRDKGPILTDLQKRLPLISGERAMKREIIMGIKQKYLQGFMVETALNQYCKAHGYSIGTVVLKGLTMRRKYEKVGSAKAVKGYAKMAFDILKAKLVIGWARLTRQF